MLLFTSLLLAALLAELTHLLGELFIVSLQDLYDGSFGIAVIEVG
jgi:hypothetical protein